MWYSVLVRFSLVKFSYHIYVLTASQSFAWTALRAVRILPVLDISTDGAVQLSFH